MIDGLAGEPFAPVYQINYIQALRKKSKKTGVCVTEIRMGLVSPQLLFQNVIESFQPYPLQKFKIQPLKFY